MSCGSEISELHAFPEGIDAIAEGIDSFVVEVDAVGDGVRL